MLTTTTLHDLVSHLDRIGLRAYMDHTGGGVMVLRVERTTDPVGCGAYCYVSGSDGEKPFETDERNMLLGANYDGGTVEFHFGVGEQDHDLYTTVRATPGGQVDAAAVRAAVQTMLANAEAGVAVLRRAMDPSTNRGMLVAGTALCTRCGEDFAPAPVYGPGTQQTVAHDECGGTGCGGTGLVYPDTVHLDRSHGDAHQDTPTRERPGPVEHTVFVAFDVLAESRGDAHRQVVDALKFTESGQPTEVSDALKSRAVESWWLIEGDAKHYDGNSNAPGRVVFG